MLRNLFVLNLGLLLFFPINSSACTAFSTADGANNSVLILKNRDEHPDIQHVVAFNPGKNNRFVALVSHKKNEDPYVLRSGINEKGLAIVNLSASILEKDPTYVDRYDDGDDFMRDILTNNTSVSDVMAHLPNLTASHPFPEFYMLADQQQTALIELTTQGRYRITLSNSGPLYHTNNFESPVFQSSNTVYENGSLNRYSRIADLMNNNPAPSLEQFKTFAHDHAAGSNDSLFRKTNTKDDRKRARTLATFLANIPKDGSAPTLYVQFDPNATVNGPSHTYTLDKNFWNFKSKTKMLASEY